MLARSPSSLPGVRSWMRMKISSASPLAERIRMPRNLRPLAAGIEAGDVKLASQGRVELVGAGVRADDVLVIEQAP